MSSLLSDDQFFGTAPTSKPGKLLSDEEFLAPRKSVKLSDAEFFGDPAPAGGSFLPEVGKGIAGGAVSTTGTMLKGAAGQNAAVLQSRIDNAKARIAIMDAIDRGETIPTASIAEGDELDTANVYRELPPEQRKAFRESQERVLKTAVQPGDVTQTPLYEAGAAVQGWSEEKFAAAKDYEDSWTRSISEGLGSVGIYGAAGLAGASTLGVAAGSFASSGEALDRAVAEGATKEQILQAIKLGGVPGLTEQIPIETLFERVPLPYIGKFGTAVGKILSQAAAEGGQEAVQQVMQNMIERYAYDPNQDLTQGVAEAAAIGAIIGGGLKGVEQGASSVLGDQPAVDLKVNEQPAATVQAEAQPTEADVLFGADPEPSPLEPFLSKPLPELEQAPDLDRPRTRQPELERARDIDRPDSPRLTPADRASPLPNSLIDDGKAILESVMTPAPLGRAPEIERAPDLSTAPVAPARPPARVMTDAEFFGAPAASAAVAPAAGNWLASLGESEQAATKAMMRDIDAKVQKAYNDPLNRTPFGQRAAGSEGARATLKANAQDAVLRAVRDGKTPDEAASIAKAEVRQTIEAHNARKPGDPMIGQHWEIGDPAIFDREIDSTAGLLRDAVTIKGREKAFAEAPFNAEQFVRAQTAADINVVGEEWAAQLAKRAPKENRDAVREYLLKARPDWAGAINEAFPLKGKAKRERAPSDIVQFLAGKGGLKDYQGELRSLDLRKTFVPGIGRLVRETGMTLDMAREAAEEAGYIGRAGEVQTTTVADLLDAIERNRRGERVYSREDAGIAEDRRLATEDTRQIAMREDWADMLAGTGVNLTAEELAEVEALVEGGMWPEEAAVEVLERGALAFEAETQENAAQGEKPYDIPFDTGSEDRARKEPANPRDDRQGADSRAARGSAPARGEPRSGEQARSPDGKPEEAELGAKPESRPTASWVIRNKKTGEVIAETFDRKKVDALNTKKYEAVPIGKYLASIGKERIAIGDLVAESKPAGTNAAGERLYENRRGRFRTRFDRKDRPEGYADFGGDLAPVDVEGDTPRFSRRAITDTPAFKNWFGDSKVVDENGEPLVVYHGTQGGDFGSFKPGTYFTTDPSEASAYTFASNIARREKMTGKYAAVSGAAELAGSRVPYYGTISNIDNPVEGQVYATDLGVHRKRKRGWDIFTDLNTDYDTYNERDSTMQIVAADNLAEAQGTVDEYESYVNKLNPGGEGGRVYPAYLSLKNPVRLPYFEGNSLGARLGATPEAVAAKIAKWQAEGYDGIVTESDDAYNWINNTARPAQYVIFEPTQVKSATGNRGTFDPADPDIRNARRQTAGSEDILGGEIQYRLSPEFIDKAEAAGKRMRATLDRMGLPGIGLRVWESMRAAVDGKTYVVEGQYLRGLIDVALEFDNPDSTLHHEALHAMKALGLFTDNEWSILSRKSNKEWRGKYDIAENYGMFPEDVQIEEGIAAAYTDWVQGARMDGLIAASFRKIKTLLKGLYQALTGQDITSVEDIFERVVSGEVGRRPVQTRGLAPLQRSQSEMVDTVDGPREQLVLPGAERISDKALAERKMEGRKGATKAQKDVGDLPLFGDAKDQMSLFQVAWHGTPHDFDEFSLDKIGTGEGAQVYGWGLYFAGKRDVAEYYREKLKRVEATVAGYDAHEVMRTPTRSDPEENLLVEIAQSLDIKLPDGADPQVQRILDDRAGGWMQGAVKHVFSTLARDLDTGKSVARALDIQRIGYDSDLRRHPEARERAAAAVRMAVLTAIEDQVEVKGQGKLYEVSVPENSDLLIWEKDLADQTPELQAKVRAAFRNLMPDYNPVGKRSMSSVYTDLMMAVGHADPRATDLPRRASEALREAGIPGHRYLDAGSRADGDGSYNYVIYDEQAIKIEARFKMREATQAVAEVNKAARAAVGSRIMDAIKRGKNDGETVGEYSHRKLIDYLHPLRTMIESVGGTVQDQMNAYLQARMADDAVVARIQDMHGQFVQPMVEALAKSGASLEDLHKYLYARHAPERNRVVGLRNEEGSDLRKAVTDHDIKGASGWSTNEAKKVLRDLRVDEKKFAGIQEAARLARQMIDANLLDQRNAGLISKETYDLLTTQWQNYVPLRSSDALDENGDFAPGRGRGFDVRGDEFHAATGRFSEAENIPAWAISLAERTHMRSEHNNVGKAVLRFLSKHDPKGEKLARVYWSKEAPGFGDLEKAPSVHRRVINSEGKAVDKVVPPSTLSPTMFAVKDGGRTYYVEFADDKVGAALKNMGVISLDAFSRLSRKWVGFQSLINTRANPAFVPINIIRDAATGGLHLLDEGFTPAEAAKIVGSIPKAWGALWRNARGKAGSGEYDTALKEYIAAGGKIAFEPHKTLEDTVNELRKQMSAALEGKKTTKAKLRAMWQTFVKFVGDLNDAGENGMRLAAYMAARDKGRTVKQAAFLGRDLTVDFKKHGEVGPLMNSWFVFFNASIQGNYNIASRLLKSKKLRRAAYMITATGVLTDLLNRSMSGDDDDGESYYSKMLRNEPWKFERQMVIFYGSEEGDYFTVPLPYGYNAIYHMGVQSSAAAFGDVDPVAAIGATTRVAFDAFNPIGSGGSTLNMFLPTVLDPAIEIATNKSFTGSPISPTRFPGDVSPDSQSHFASTPDAFRKTAEFFNWATGGNEVEPGLMDVSPDTYEHLFGYITGGIGRFFGQSLEAGEKIVTGNTDELEWENIPIVRSFRGKYDDDGRRAEYYRLREEVQTAKTFYVDYLQAGNDEGAEDYKSRHPVEVDAIGAFDGAEKQLRKVRKAKRAIDLNDDLTRAEKDEQLKPLEEIEMQIMNAARLAYSEARKAQD